VVAALAGAYLVAVGWVAWRGLDDHLARADVIVVPGNTVAPDGTPSPRLAARLDAALQLYRAGWAPVILVSGGTGVEGVDEAAAMATYLRAHGVPGGAVVQDPAGVDTEATAVHTASYLRGHGLRTAIVATQWFHVPRTRLLLEQRGVRVTGSTHARFAELRDVYSVVREVPALALALLTG
jgi:vancomycin permeability regulator SanA